MEHSLADEAARNDRQLRVWGVETQKRLSDAKMLIAGCNSLGAEVAKNVVLAGVGSVTLVDDTACSLRAPGNFLIPGDNADANTTAAEASVATLQELNPFVKVHVLAGPVAGALTAAVVEGYDVVLLCGQPSALVNQADRLCATSGAAFFAAASRGIFGWSFVNLHKHDYVAEKTEGADGSGKKDLQQHSLSFPSWEQATTCSLEGRPLGWPSGRLRAQKNVHPLYALLRAGAALEEQLGRPLERGDAPALQEAIAALAESQGLREGVLEAQAVEAYAAEAQEMAPVSAILGGMLANEVVKAVSHKWEPLCNFFLFTLVDGAGSTLLMP